MRKYVIVVWALGLVFTGCKKKDSACKKKCKKLLACYEETRGRVVDDKAAIRRCERICDSKSKSRYKKAIQQFGKKDCVDFMRSYKAEARFLMETKAKGRRAGKGPRGRATRRSGLAPGEHPFPKLQARPPSDPKARRGWRSPVQKDVDKIVIMRPDETIELKRLKAGTKPGDVGDWQVAKPSVATADRFAVRNLLNRLERMVIREKAADIEPKDFVKHGLDDKRGIRCRVYIGDTTIADLIVGKAERRGRAAMGPRRRGGITTLIRKAGTNDVYRVMGSLTYIFKRASSGWRDATVINVRREDLAKLTLKLTTGTLSLKRDPNEENPRKRFTNWEIVSAKPPLANLDQSSVTRLVSVLTRLRATSFVKDAKPEKTQLERPRATIELTDKAGKTTVLLIGAKDGRRRAAFALLKGDKRVFLVRHPLDELAEQPIANFRDKQLVAAKTGEITALTVIKGGQTVKFAKTGRVWKVVEPAGIGFDRNKLMGTVRMLEGRFSAHKFADKTDPAATGLNKPAGRIIVTVKPEKKPAKTVEVLVGKAGPRGDFYVKVKGQKETYLVRRWVLNRVYRGPKEWSRQAAKRKPRRR